jgi:EAL domain-containing protein (putative c-di-GMP-specific phosphodiesterase class I)
LSNTGKRGIGTAASTIGKAAELGCPRTLVNDAARGLDEKEFFFVFQPKLRLQPGLLSGFESLIRWRHPTYGVLMPSVFIELVENSPLTQRFTEFAIAESARVLASWTACGYGSLSLSINLPAQEIMRPGMVDELAVTLASRAVRTERLQIEITEANDPGPIDMFASAVTSVRNMGVSVAIDDFGAGCWSLIALHRLSIDTIKLDRSFIRDIPENPESRAVVEALISLGRRLGKQVVIEGIETEAQFAWLKTMTPVDCQGYYVSEPVQEAEISGLVAKHGVLI